MSAIPKQLIKKLEQIRKNIRLERDRLRALEGEIKDLLDPTDEGLDYLESAVDKFSEQA
jgi:hypothetical protein